MLQGKKFTKSDEQELALNGSKRTYPFYVAGIPIEFAKKFECKITIYADNKFFASVLQKAILEENRISVVHKKVTIPFITKLLGENPIICHIDDHSLGDFSHASHFVVLEKSTEKFFFLIDPWSGKRKKIAKNTLVEAINSLKTQIKMCPLLISIRA
jgi:hypothetical protein